MKHWRDVFGGELQIMRYGDMPAMEGMGLTPAPNAVAHAILELDCDVIAGGASSD